MPLSGSGIPQRPLSEPILRTLQALSDTEMQLRQISSPKLPEESTILVAAEDQRNRDGLAKLLHDAGYQVQTASDSEHTLRLLQDASDVKLLLLDLSAPGMDRPATVHWFREIAGLGDVGIIAIDERTLPKAAILSLDSGADDFVSRPIDAPVLLARIRAVLRSYCMANRVRQNNRMLKDDLTAAREVLLSVVPLAPFFSVGYHADWRYAPSTYVGGDMLDIALLGENRLGFYVCDVSGHGVAAAMLAIWVHHFLRPEASARVPGNMTLQDLPALGELLNPDRPLARLDKVLGQGRIDRYLTAVYCVLDCRSGRLSYCAAGHPRPIVVHTDGTQDVLDIASTPVGMGLGLPFQVGQHQLRRGDRLFLYTDGLTEVMAPNGECFGTERLKYHLNLTRQARLGVQLDEILRGIADFSGELVAEDDISLFGLEVTNDTNISTLGGPR